MWGIMCSFIFITVPCERGTYYVKSVNRCIPCAKGMFQPLEKQLTCVPCPLGTTSIKTGATICTGQCLIRLYHRQNFPISGLRSPVLDLRRDHLVFHAINWYVIKVFYTKYISLYAKFKFYIFIHHNRKLVCAHRFVYACLWDVVAQLARACISESKGTEFEPPKSQAMLVCERGPLT